MQCHPELQLGVSGEKAGPEPQSGAEGKLLNSWLLYWLKELVVE